MNTQLLIVIVIGALAIALVAWWYVQTRRREHLRARFGPEYERALRESGGRADKAEAILVDRERRIEKLHIRPLTPEESGRFAESWRRVQSRFVDDPKGAVTEADRLVTEVMSTRGYPMADWEQRVADISVDHSRVCENYRLAHEVALRHERGEASTEDLRQAMVHYRALFDELVETVDQRSAQQAQRRAG